MTGWAWWVVNLVQCKRLNARLWREREIASPPVQMTMRLLLRNLFAPGNPEGKVRFEEPSDYFVVWFGSWEAGE